jgi:uncharacterized protein YjdB
MMRLLLSLFLVLAITPSTSTVNVGKSIQLKATCDGADCTQTVAWASQLPHVASVSSGGVVTGISAGKAGIMATSSGQIAGTVVTVQK